MSPRATFDSPRLTRQARLRRGLTGRMGPHNDLWRPATGSWRRGVRLGLLAAGSPLTVAGAVPVLHRTSLSHRCRPVAQADMPRHPSPQFAMLPPLREQEGKNEDRGWLMRLI
jgi:hypothetical protein